MANCLLGLAFGLWIVALLRGEAALHRAAIYLPALGYVAASLGAIVFSQSPRQSLGEPGDLLTLALLPMVVSLLDRKRWDWLMAGLVAVAVASSVVGLWQYWNGASTLAERLRGLTNHYMTFSGWTLAVTLLLVGDIAFNRDRRRLWWSAPAFLVCSATLLLSYSRNAWVGLATGLVLVAAVWKPRALYLYPVLAMVLVMALPGSVLERAVTILDLTHPSNYDRLCMVRSGTEMVKDHPLFGVGLGMVKPTYPEYREPDAPRQRIPHLHNNSLQIAAERGVTGLLAYWALLLTFLVSTWRRLGRGRRADLPALAGCFLAIAGVTVAGLFEYNWGDAEVWIVTLTLLSVPSALTADKGTH
jgi:O-antigen ligase